MTVAVRCAWCRARFETDRKNRRYCTENCRSTAACTRWAAKKTKRCASRNGRRVWQCPNYVSHRSTRCASCAQKLRHGTPLHA